MKTFTIDDQNNITAFGTQEEAAATTATPFDSFSSEKELAELAGVWAPDGLLAIWDGLPGVKPLKGFKSAKAGASRIWASIQRLGEPEKPTAERKTKGGARTAKATPAKSRGPREQRPPTVYPRLGRTLMQGKPIDRDRAKAPRRPKWLRCCSGRMGPHWGRSCKR